MAYNFPVADFSGLADIPNIYNESRKEGLRQSLFADLKSVKSDQDLRDLGTRALRAGLIPEGMNLMREATGQQQAQQAGLLNKLMIEYLGKTKGGGADTGDILPPTALTPPAAVPVAPAPQTPAPIPYLPGSGAALTAPQGGGTLSPTDQVLAQAQRGQLPPTPPVQLAGPPPTPDTVPPSLNAPPPSQLTPTASPRGGTMLQALPGMPAAEGPTISPNQLPPAPAGVPPMGGAPTAPAAPMPGASFSQSQQEVARLEANRLADQIRRFPAPPRGMPTPPALQALHDAYQRAVTIASAPSTEEQTYQQERAIKQAAEGQDLTRYSFGGMEKTVGERATGIRNALEGYKKQGAAGDQLGEVVKQLGDIYKNPNFVTDSPIAPEWWNKLGDYFTSKIANGIEAMTGQSGDFMRQTVTTREAFKQLAPTAAALMLQNQGIDKNEKDTLGPLIPQLSQTTEGLQTINEAMRRASDINKVAYDAALSYANSDKAKGFRGSPEEMHAAVAEKIAEYKKKNGSIITNADGTATTIGKKIEQLTGQPIGRKFGVDPVLGGYELIGGQRKYYHPPPGTGVAGVP